MGLGGQAPGGRALGPETSPGPRGPRSFAVDLESLPMAQPPRTADGQELSPIALEVQRAQAGDAAAFDRLHAHFARSVHAVLLARLASADADDGLQETFVLAWQRIHSLRDACAAGPWLHAIARNVARDRRRAARGRPETRELHGGLAAGDGGDGADRDELRERVMEHLRSLPEAYKETLTMRLVEGLSGPEIAAATGLTEGSVRVNLCRGMGLLRELLTKEGWP